MSKSKPKTTANAPGPAGQAREREPVPATVDAGATATAVEPQEQEPAANADQDSKSPSVLQDADTQSDQRLPENVQQVDAAPAGADARIGDAPAHTGDTAAADAKQVAKTGEHQGELLWEYEVLSPLDHDNKFYGVGARVQLPVAVATRLVGRTVKLADT